MVQQNNVMYNDLDPVQLFDMAKQRGIDEVLNNMLLTSYGTIEQLKGQFDNHNEAVAMAGQMIAQATTMSANLHGDLCKWFNAMGYCYSAESIFLDRADVENSRDRSSLFRYERTKKLEAAFAAVINKFKSHAEYQRYLVTQAANAE